MAVTEQQSGRTAHATPPPNGPTTPDEFVEISRTLRDQLAATSQEVDAAGSYPFDNMELIHASGLNHLTIPRAAGGVAPDSPGEWLPELVEVLVNLGAGESSTAQIWAFNRGQCNALLGADSPLPEATRQRLVAEVLDEGIRFCSPMAERYTAGRFNFQVPIRHVDGGVVINGTKYFATGSAGARYGHSTGLLDGYDSVKAGGAHDVLVDLRDPNVELHDDWDNMGQRATSSGAVTFHDVFVPDGFHWSPADGGFEDPGNVVGVLNVYSLTPIILGIGFGALDALRAHLDERPTFPGIFEDTSSQFQIGAHVARLHAAEASLLRAAQTARDFLLAGAPVEHRAEVSIAGIRAKVSVVDAVITFTSQMHQFLGGQSSSNAHGYDRFWRNARTLSLQDVMAVKTQQVGAWALSDQPPPITWVS